MQRGGGGPGSALSGAPVPLGPGQQSQRGRHSGLAPNHAGDRFHSSGEAAETGHTLKPGFRQVTFLFCVQGGELKPQEMPAGWRSAAGLCRLPYSHPLCGSSLISVVAVNMGPLLVVNGDPTLLKLQTFTFYHQRWCFKLQNLQNKTCCTLFFCSDSEGDGNRRRCSEAAAERLQLRDRRVAR